MTVRDPEILFQLHREPELLAIADALADVLGDTAAVRKSARRRRLAAFAVVAAAAAIAAVAVFNGGRVEPTLVDRALAAVGNEPVLHAVLRQRLAPETTLYELSTGRRVDVPQVVRTEVWFDQDRGLKHVLTNKPGLAAQDELDTPQGDFTEAGPVWTCARIAAHPIEATRARVSCNFNGDNGTTPRQIPEEPATLDPALVGFLDDYRAALASGAARQVGEGTADGRHVYWLELRIPDRYHAAGEPPIDLRERVAVASDSYRPLLIRPITNGKPGDEYEVVDIGTVPRSEADFSKPKVPPGAVPISEDSRVTGELDLAGAAQVLGAQPLWAGPELGALKLAGVQQREITIGYGPDSGVPPRRANAIAVVYGEIVRRHAAPGSVEIMESTEADAVWWEPTPPPPAGYVSVGRFGIGTLRLGNVYVAIDVTGGPSGDVTQTVVDAARALVAAPPS